MGLGVPISVVASARARRPARSPGARTGPTPNSNNNNNSNNSNSYNSNNDNSNNNNSNSNSNRSNRAAGPTPNPGGDDAPRTRRGAQPRGRSPNTEYLKTTRICLFEGFHETRKSPHGTSCPTVDPAAAGRTRAHRKNKKTPKQMINKQKHT